MTDVTPTKLLESLDEHTKECAELRIKIFSKLTELETKVNLLMWIAGVVGAAILTDVVVRLNS